MVDDLIKRAQDFAIQVHAGQVRPNKAQDPFMTHPQETALLVEKSGGSDEEIAAAWLHDSVEDTPATVEEITKLFGDLVGVIVDGMTDPLYLDGLPTFERKSQQAERVQSKNDSVKRVKLADQTSNIRSVAVDPPVGWDKLKCIDYILT